MSKINNDGSMKGETFSGSNYKGDYPHPKEGETYAEYRERITNLKEQQGFHLGDLSWDDWQSYCIGSGYWEDISANEEIF